MDSNIWMFLVCLTASGACATACGGSTAQEGTGGPGGQAGTTGGSGAAGAAGGDAAGDGSGGGGADAAPDTPPKSCGGIADVGCAPDEWCDFPDGSYCGGDDSQGVCRKRPGACDLGCPPGGVCGCDGKAYCNPCEAHAHGVDTSSVGPCWQDAGAGDASDAAVKSCGGKAGGKCGPDEWCDFPDSSQCGANDAQGVCKPRPKACPDYCKYPMPCGCDGKPYCSECDANANGTDTFGTCSEADAGKEAG